MSRFPTSRPFAAAVTAVTALALATVVAAPESAASTMNYAVTATITAGSGAAWSAVNPLTGAVYVSNSSTNTVSVINGATNQVTGTITLADGVKLFGVAVNPTTNKVYVSAGSLYSNDNYLVVVDGATNTIDSTRLLNA